ncbi:OmpA family protein [Sandarakinorhabdus sp.]|jgi:outer membrane protein OmpA-like peptidoglycan-associated protein|uniref:OmpA family protein n=1 Tax=Sandarakinorhabdus sp. TaxID=1916663 RepID=UPI0028B0C8E8|nr:OmpA family protein [Sandarakinorhabdus sp.]
MTLKNVIMIAALSGALALGGCVTDPETGDRRISRPAGTAAAGAGAGALLGALLGGRNNRAEVLIGAGVGAIAGGAVGSYMDKQARELKQRTAGSGIEVEQRGDEIAIKLPSGIAFDTNESSVRPDMRPALDQVAKTLASYQSTFIDVTGHTDSTGGDAINQPLSDRRASAVADYLQYQGVQRARMATRGYGAQMPVATNDTDAGRAQNRRVEIRLSPVTQSDVARPNS